MIPDPESEEDHLVGIPRTSGDDPMGLEVEAERKAYSPHKRG